MHKIIPWVVTGGAILAVIIWGLFWVENKNKIAANNALVSELLLSHEAAQKEPQVTPEPENNFDISSLNLSGVEYRIPLALLSSSTSYRIGETLRFSYDYPKVLAQQESEEVFCDQKIADQHVITSSYLLDDLTGKVVGIPTIGIINPGKHELAWPTAKTVAFGGQDYIATTTPVGHYRLLVVSRIPESDPKPTCESNKKNHGPMEWMDTWIGEGRLLEDATSTLRAIGYTQSFKLE